MKIIQIEIQNNRAVKCFNVRLDGDNMTVAGDTGTGKTTAISALWDIIKNAPDAVTHGEIKGAIKVKLSDGSKSITAVRTNTPAGSKVVITDSEGDSISMADFKKLISSLSVNPHQIISMKPTEQVRTLAAAADLGDVDLAQMDTDIQTATEERLDLYRELEHIAPGEEPEKAERVDVSALVAEKDAADAANYDRAGDERELSGMVQSGETLKNDIADLEATLATKKADLEELRTKAGALQEKLKKTPVIPTEEITAKIDSAQDANEKAATHERWFKAFQLHAAKTAQHAASDKKVKALVAAKKKALDNAKWPLEGLAIEEGNILYKECLLGNLGTSEQLLVCSALALADIKAHALKVVRLDGIEQMSRDDFAALTELFNGHGIQVLSTRVSWGDTEPGEIVITDGEYVEETT